MSILDQVTEYTRLRFVLEGVRHQAVRAACQEEFEALTDKSLKSVSAQKKRGERDAAEHLTTIRCIDAVFHTCDNMMECGLEMPDILGALVPYLAGVIEALKSTDGAA